MPGMTDLRVHLRGSDRVLWLLRIETLTRDVGQARAAELLGVSYRTLKRILAEERRKAAALDVKRHVRSHVRSAKRARRAAK